MDDNSLNYFYIFIYMDKRVLDYLDLCISSDS